MSRYLFYSWAAVLLLGSLKIAKAQELNEKKAQFPIEISGFNNGTFLPGKGKVGVWSGKFHPGIRLGTRYHYFIHPKSQLYQALYLSYFRHAHAQKGLQVYTDFGYRYTINSYLFAEGSLGLGYMSSTPDLEVFEFKNGDYNIVKNATRSQWMGSLTLKFGADFEPWISVPLSLYIGYQFWAQSPFINIYVPVLPNNAIHLGVIFQWSHLKK